MSLESRLNRLEANLGRADQPCPGDTTHVLHYWQGEAEPEVPVDARRCSLCGEVHPLYIKLIPDPNFYGNADRLAERKKSLALNASPPAG
jgi:hypothetical protein